MPSRPRMSSRRVTLIGFFAAIVLAVPMGVLASHQFTDVPNGYLYHGDIDALVDAGVTGGCGGGKYCPTDFVTRGQMAAFMNRLGALGPGKPPVTNATTVDGYDANELTRFAAEASSPFQTLDTPGTFELVESVSITAPAPGFVMVQGAATVAAFTAGCSCEVTVLLSASSGTPDLIDDFWQNEQVGPDGGSQEVGNVSVQWVFEVDAAGPHTFYMHAVNNSGSADPFLAFVQMTAEYSPFGSTGGSTLGITEGPAAPSTTSASQD